MDTPLVFVSVDSKDGRVGKLDRPRIRRRCMQGKNRKSTARQNLVADEEASGLPEERTQKTLAIRTSQSEDERGNRLGKVPARGRKPKESSPSRRLEQQQRYDPELDVELVRYIHQDSNIYPREFIATFNRFREVKGMNAPLYSMLHFQDLEETDSRFVLLQDVPFQQAMKLTVSAFSELVKHSDLSTNTYKHHQGTVTLLNARLSGMPENFLIDTTIYIINMLATIAMWLGRQDEIGAHIAALRHIIRLRGGKSFLLGRHFVRFQMQSLDLANFMFSGNASNLGEFDLNHNVFLNSSAASLPESIKRLIDSRISSIYLDFRETVARINLHISQGKTLLFSEFQPRYGSILHRLTDLGGSIDDATSECFRFGLLAFLLITSVRIPSNESTRANKAKRYAYLTSNYRKACQRLDIDTPQLSTLMFWLFTVGAISVFNVDEEDWLVNAWNEISKTLPGARLSWEGTKAYLEDVLWIGSAHDSIGREAYDDLIKRGPSPVE